MSSKQTALLGLVIVLASAVLSGIRVATLVGVVPPKYWDIGPNGGSSDSGCEYPLNEIRAPTAMAQHESRSLVVTLRNLDGKECNAKVRLAAPAFDVDPVEREVTIALPGNEDRHVVWVIVPKHQGNQEVVVHAGYYDFASVTIAVTTVLGLSPKTAAILSYCGYVLGPLLTLPWWLGVIRRRRDMVGEERKQQEKIILPPNMERRGISWWKFWKR